jgi:hypothetical protein
VPAGTVAVLVEDDESELPHAARRAAHRSIETRATADRDIAQDTCQLDENNCPESASLMQFVETLRPEIRWVHFHPEYLFVLYTDIRPSVAFVQLMPVAENDVNVVPLILGGVHGWELAPSLPAGTVAVLVEEVESELPHAARTTVLRTIKVTATMDLRMGSPGWKSGLRMNLTRNPGRKLRAIDVHPAGLTCHLDRQPPQRLDVHEADEAGAEHGGARAGDGTRRIGHGISVSGGVADRRSSEQAILRRACPERSPKRISPACTTTTA